MPEVERVATVIRLSDGRELAFAEYGDADGIPVFGFHGTPGSHRQLERSHDAGRALGVRVIAPDRPGYGFSDYHKGRSLLDWPRDVAAVADFLGLERFGVFGVSGGGPHAAVCAYALGPRLLGCAIVSGVGPVADEGSDPNTLPTNKAFFWLSNHAPQLLEPIFRGFHALLRRYPDAAFRQMAKQLPEADRKIMARREIRESFQEDGRRSSRSSSRAAAQDFLLFSSPWGFRLQDIAVPVELWQGDTDRNVPPSHAKLQADAIPNAKLHLCPGEGHLLVIDRAADILRAAAGTPSP